MDSGFQCPDCGKVLPDFLPGGLCPFCTFEVVLDTETQEMPVEESPEIPGFQLHEEVGEGGFGIVYKATQTGRMRRRVALKVLKQGVDTRQVLRRFEMERQALALLEHPNIARIYEAGKTSKGLPYFTMEYVDGQPITDALAGATQEVLLETIIQVCSAVSHAHGKGVLHRDLKPSNILVTHGGVAKVIDFGVAKALDSRSAPGMTMYTGHGDTLGTLAYMAPEQADTKIVDVDERVDVYSLGAVLYELLAGVNPYEMREENELPSKPSALALQKVAPDLDRITMRALAEDRNERYASMGELAADLRRFLNGDRIEKRKPTKKRAWIWGVVAALVVAGGWLILRERPAEQAAVLPQEAKGIRHHAYGHPNKIEIHPSGTRALAFYRGQGLSVVFDPRTGEKLGELKSDVFYIRSAGFSVDGKELLVGYSRGAMQRYDIASGKATLGMVQTRLTPKNYPCDFVFEFEENGELRTATVSDHRVLAVREREGKVLRMLPTGHYTSVTTPDRSAILFGSHEGPLRLWEIGSGAIKTLHGHHKNFLETVVSDDGKFFASSDHAGVVGVWTREGERLHLIQHPGECHEVNFSPDGKLLATGCFDGWVRLYEVESGKLVSKLNHVDQTFSLDFSPDGKLLAVGGSEGLVRFWNVEDGSQVMEPWKHESSVMKVILHPRMGGGLNVITMTTQHGLAIRSLQSLRERP